MEERGDGGGRRRRLPPEGGLDDIVLSWSISQILDEGFLKDQVEKIPSTFFSVGHYFESFAFPLLEDTRSELCSSLDDISNAPCARILSKEEGSRKTKSEHTLEYFIDVEFPRNFVDGGSKGYKARNGDLFILSSIELQAVNDLGRHSVTYCLASVTEVAMDEATQKGFAVKIAKNIYVEDDISNYNFAYFLTNLLTNIRIWRALSFTHGMRKNFSIIEEVLFPKVGARHTTCLSRAIDHCSTKLSEKLLSIQLNQSQMGAIEAAIHAAQCTDSHFVELVWGPPGTGKTKTVSAMLWLFLHMKCRTLVCAPTNVAVVGVCSRLLELIKNLDYQEKQNRLPTSLGNVILFGNRDRMDIDDELQDVFLDYRVDQLLSYFTTSTGWRHRIASAISLLEDSSSAYDLFLENNKEEKVLVFSEFLRKQFDAVIVPLKDCIRNLLIHTNCVSSNNAFKMTVLLELLETMSNLLCSGDLGDDQLKEVFLQDYSESSLKKNIHDCFSSKHELCASKRLSEAREKAVHLLRYLQGALSFPITADKSRIRDFCLQSASLIFCTASSSSMLHYVEMDPLRVLVIDEAAQLKECESTIPLRLDGLKHAILVGDECQLPSTVKSQVSKDAGFNISLFERLGSLGQQKHLLNMQYRMHPFISLFPNSRFYRKQILDGPNVKDAAYNRRYEDLPYGAYAFLNVVDGIEEMDENSSSKRNWVEVAVVLHLIQNLFKHWEISSEVLSIGVISPYTSQVNAIKDKLGNIYESFYGFDVRVKSIDGFQGEENDVIILSTVRCNCKGNIGFLQDHQRANVALTRARHCLWVVGNANTFVQSGTIWENLVHDAKTRGCYFNANEDANLSKAILHIKYKLAQLDDLLRSDSSLFINARWKVLFSDDFRKSFAKLKQNQFKMEVLQLLLTLAKGWRSKRKAPDFTDKFGLVRIYKVKEFYLIWTVDITKNERYVQVIKVWDLLPWEQIARLVSRLNHIFSMYTEAYLNHCTVVCTEGKLEVPMSWNFFSDLNRYKTVDKVKSIMEEDATDMELVDGMENSKVSESLVLMKFYSLSSGVVRHLLTACDGTEIDIPFELTDQEKEIICFPLSTFILGRSGTGKTTILTMKLIQKEQHYSIAAEGVSEKADSSNTLDKAIVLKKNSSQNNENILKQIFVTVSSKLCSAIRSHIKQLRSFTCGENPGVGSSQYMHDNSELSDFLDIPDSFCCLKQQHYPLIITFHKLLLMLDGTMRRSFFDKYYSQWGINPDHSGNPKSFALQAFILSKEVNYEKFAGSYWPHFNEQLTKMVDASTVFTQIISHIKGGLESGMTPTGRLSKEDYLLLSEKRVSTLSTQTREIIYDIFIDYENKKVLNSEFDLSDFINDLHHQLSSDGYDGDMIDFIYIDEVQDLTMRQIGLLKYICKNFEEGYTFAGDTAQTIARGIDFRFQDIRCLFYKEFLPEVKSGDPENKKENASHMSDIFHLNQNFRTHVGILSLAQSIMDLLYCYFPMSVDKLTPEFSLIYGEPPVLLESSNDENAILTIFGNSGGMQSSLSGFGSEQVILVRDTETKEQIFGLLGKQALALTILECKGLEFQDVLLYNFFGASPLKKKWRVIYEYMNSQDILEPSISRSFPSFEQERHNLLCSELKQLYVAITRTKQRLWICENTDEYCKPMFDYWKKLCLVQVRHLDASLAQAMKAASSAEDWRVRGIKLFNEGNFELATMCFDKAGDRFSEKWAKAAGLVANADRVISTNLGMAEIALRNAAEIYESIGKPESAATCYIKLNDFKKAGMTYMEKCGISRLKDAGDCFAMAECWTHAANAYAKGKCFSECLSVCSKGGMFDTGLQIIEQWREASCFDEQQDRLKQMISSFVENCAVYYLELGDIQRMLKFLKSFSSNDILIPLLNLVRNFLKSRNLLVEMLTVEQELGNYLEAASIARMKGDMLLEAKMFEKAKYFEESARLFLFYVLIRSLWPPESNGWPLKRFAEKENLLLKARELAKSKSGSFEEYVFLEAEILSDKERSLSDMSRHLFEAQKHQNVRQKVFTTRAILDVHIQSKPLKFLFQQSSISTTEKLAYDMMSKNHIAVETMMYVWNLWKTMVLNLLSYLKNPEVIEDDHSGYQEFYLEYFGVRKEGKEDNCVLQIPEASWVKNTVKVFLRREKNVVWMAGDECISCAIFYWSRELFSVGMKVLESLEDLRRNFFEKYPSSKGRMAIWMFEVAKFLAESEFTSARSTHRTLGYLESSQTCYLDTVFPLDCRDDTMENLLLLHENNIAMEMVNSSLDVNLSSRNGNLTHGQTGRLVMLLLVTGRLPDELFKRILSYLDNGIHWKEFIEQYKNFLDFGFGKIPVMSKLQIALESTFDAYQINESDCLPLHVLIYLMEILLFISSSSHELKRYLFTTKFSLFQMLKSYGCGGYMETCLSAVPAQSQYSVQLTLEFIIQIATNILSDKRRLVAWTKMSSIAKGSFSTLVLKLVIIICIAYLNTGKSIYQVGRFLFDKRIFNDLPMAFANKLHHTLLYGTGDRNQFLRGFAEALITVKNPLVIVCSQESQFRFSNVKALTISCKDMKCREKISVLLFPEMKTTFWDKLSKRGPVIETSSAKEADSISLTISDEKDQGTGPGAKAPDSIPLSISEEKDQGTGPGAKAPDSIPLSISEEKDQGTGPGAKDIDKGVIEQHNHFWLKLEEFLSGKTDDVEDAINMLGSALENVDSKDFDERFITEVRNVHKELKLLAGLRSEGAPEGHPTRAILHAKCKGLRANFELLMGKLFSLIQGTSGEGKNTDNKDDTLDCDSNAGEAEVLPESSSSIQTKASKGKQNKKSQKKSKSKNKRR